MVGKAKEIRARRSGNQARDAGGYGLLEGKTMKAIQTLAKTCPHLTVMDGTIEIISIVEMP